MVVVVVEPSRWWARQWLDAKAVTLTPWAVSLFRPHRLAELHGPPRKMARPGGVNFCGHPSLPDRNPGPRTTSISIGRSSSRAFSPSESCQYQLRLSHLRLMWCLRFSHSSPEIFRVQKLHMLKTLDDYPNRHRCERAACFCKPNLLHTLVDFFDLYDVAVGNFGFERFHFRQVKLYLVSIKLSEKTK